MAFSFIKRFLLFSAAVIFLCSGFLPWSSASAFFFSSSQDPHPDQEFWCYSLSSSRVEVALEAARAAVAGGIPVLEVVLSTPGVFEVKQQLSERKRYFSLHTILRVEDAKTAIKAGAKFLMSPAIVKDIMDYVQCTESLYIPGAMTPTEILSAYETGAKIIKVYPVSARGGVRYISALKKPFAQIPLVASQGITIGTFAGYLVN
ncbi:hypothetical protein QN277_025910 [Acacia crassicarpa]|uniref:Uncharacterized protein n=1 Tax=Acacia crassicarpa TaxID=499986 RepID=A0AAE1J6U1_9FABA|nr:hypothetical protein QN277_025910 [Acacia crassicarpa]